MNEGFGGNLMEIYKTTNSNHTAAFFRLVDSMKRAKQNGRPFCLFIGAGCSLSSAVHPITTEQVIKDCLIRCMDPGMNGYNFSKKRQLLHWGIVSVNPKTDMTLNIGNNANSFQGEVKS